MGGGSSSGLRGVESLPVGLLLTAVVSCMVVSAGVRGVELFWRKKSDLDAVREFNALVEEIWCLHEKESALVSVTKAEIVLEGKTATLLKPRRAETLPFPVSERVVLSTGTYELRLRKTKNGWYLDVRAHQ